MNSEPVRTFFRLLGALAVAAGGLLHLKLWNDPYRDIVSGTEPGLWVVQVGFLIHGIVSLVLAAAIVIVRRPIVWFVGVAHQLVAIGALALSRQASLFGWKEPGWDGDARTALILELAAVAALSLTVALDLMRIQDENELATY